ncbi:MAG: hypothetical protein H0X69_17425 [Gemmatimonadales bacterium]|jgi:plastocyanin|nr:hypothetical protein [Gemmatimonadales bacterium]
MKKWTAMAGMGLALTATACGSSSPPMGGGSPSATTTAALVTSPQPYGEVIGGRVVINIAELMFQPDEVEIPAGTTAIFTNNDQVPHAVAHAGGPGPKFDSGPIQPGGTYQQIFRDPGTVRIEDSESSDTTMTIKVEEAP